jgi:RecB family exonuclease
VYWLYRRIFGLEKYESDAALLDDESLGNMYHAMLEKLFSRIKERGGGSFEAMELDLYYTWAEEIAPEVLRSGGKFRGLLAYPLQNPLAAAMVKRIRALLKTEAKYFSGYAVAALEKKLYLSEAGVQCTGKIDRVSFSPADKSPMIIDYKTGSTPTQTQSREGKDGIADFQIPMYVKLLEAELGRQVSQAYFFSINKHDLTLVVGELEKKRSFSREKYQTTLDALDTYIERFHRSLTDLDFSLEHISFKTCHACPFKTICRSVYSLNAEEDDPAAEDYEEDEGEEDEDEFFQ